MKDPRGRLNPLVFQDRESGVTQTGVVEKMWTFEAIKDVVKAVKIIEAACAQLTCTVALPGSVLLNVWISTLTLLSAHNSLQKALEVHF